MNKHVCPNCGNISYSADNAQAHLCPRCTEKHIIVNHDFMELLKSYNNGNLKLTINRRNIERRVSAIQVGNDRRSTDRRNNNATPIGWLLLKSPSMTA